MQAISNKINKLPQVDIPSHDDMRAKTFSLANIYWQIDGTIDQNKFNKLDEKLKKSLLIAMEKEAQFWFKIDKEKSEDQNLMRFLIEDARIRHITICCTTLDAARMLTEQIKLLEMIDNYVVNEKLEVNGRGFEDNPNFQAIRWKFNYFDELALLLRKKLRCPDPMEVKLGKDFAYAKHTTTFHQAITDAWCEDLINFKIIGIGIKPLGRGKQPLYPN